MSHKKITIEQYLKNNDINFIESSGYIVVWCPFCQKMAGLEKQLTFQINPNDGHMQCQSCYERPSLDGLINKLGFKDKIISISDGEITIEESKPNMSQINTDNHGFMEKKFQPKIWSLDELLSYPFPEQKWLVDRIIPVGTVNMISSEPTTGKTWITLELSRCVATGEKFLGEFGTTQGAVLMINLEDSAMYTQERLKILTVISEAPISFISEEVDIENQATVDFLLDIATERNVKLIIFDSFRRLHTGDENESKTSNDIFRQLKKFSATGMAVLVTHHHRKQQGFGSSDPSQRIRGSSDIFAAIDSHLAIEKGGNDLHVYQTKMKVARALEPFKILKDESWHLTYGGKIDGKEHQKDKAKTAILIILKDGPSDRKNIEAKILEVEQIGKTAVGKALMELRREEEILVRIEGKVKKIYYLPNDIEDGNNKEELTF